ncbi:LytTR family transcriptional regulator DNA-binding domain-containing protein [Sphingobacterium sp.]|uniref:LytTR family transcriptional regulator DNA-binding domain-containing protein n=1 Tax=Sphingobacterium sp. TaxID=341027 RepID=UPI00289E2FC1|nr:LytTR family transcriptional regulator DNA-binding domain-containing protein [Sphingobacterium sp.]
MAHTPVPYKDRIFRAIACLLAAHFIVMMGRPGLKTVEAFLIPSYYPTLAINYAIALIIGLAVKKVTVILDRGHEWYRDVWRRAMLQFFFGVVAVSILSFFLVWAYFLSFGQDITASGYLDFELPFSIALITILNFYYAASYFYLYPRSLPPKSSTGKLLIDPGIERATEQEFAFGRFDPQSLAAPESDTNAPFASSRMNGIFILETPTRSIPVKIKNIAMFFIYEKMVYAQPKGVRSLDECYLLTTALTDIEKTLDAPFFFRLNRWCIMNFDIIADYQYSEKRRLLVNVRPEQKIENGLSSQAAIKLYSINAERITAFKKWMSNTHYN